MHGWKKTGRCSLYKIIDGRKFTITPTGAEFVLSFESSFRIAERSTIEECQDLAEDTIKRWKGKKK